MKSMRSSQCVRSIPRSGWINHQQRIGLQSSEFLRLGSRQRCPAPGIVLRMARKSSPPRTSQGSSADSTLSDTPRPAIRPPALEIYDTTLRDGAQAEDVTFSADDKVRVAQQLDGLGVQFLSLIHISEPTRQAEISYA